MHKRFFRAILTLTLVSAGILCTACDTGILKTPGALEGYWKASYGDGFEISGTSFSQYDNGTKTKSFAGTIVGNPDMDAASGFLTIKITEAGTWMKTVDSYLVIGWKNLSGSGVAESTPYKAGANSSGLATQALAESEYTEANGYFAMYADYLRQ